MPQYLAFQSDNTMAQSNSILASVFLAYLVGCGRFLTATLYFPSVGRTHEDVDRMLALVLLKVLQPCRWEVPSDLVELLKEKLQQHVADKNENLIFEEVWHIHDFGPWLDPLGITLHNCIVSCNGTEAAHSFAYKARACPLEIWPK